MLNSVEFRGPSKLSFYSVTCVSFGETVRTMHTGIVPPVRPWLVQENDVRHCRSYVLLTMQHISMESAALHRSVWEVERV